MSNTFNVWESEDEINEAFKIHVDSIPERLKDKLKLDRTKALMSKNSSFYRLEAGSMKVPAVIDANLTQLEDKHIQRVIARNSKYALIEMDAGVAIRLIPSLCSSLIMWRHFGKIILDQYLLGHPGRIRGWATKNIKSIYTHDDDVYGYGEMASEVFGLRIKKGWYVTKPITSHAIDGSEVIVYLNDLMNNNIIDNLVTIKLYNAVDAKVYMFHTDAVVPRQLAKLLTHDWPYAAYAEYRKLQYGKVA